MNSMIHCFSQAAALLILAGLGLADVSDIPGRFGED